MEPSIEVILKMKQKVGGGGDGCEPRLEFIFKITSILDKMSGGTKNCSYFLPLFDRPKINIVFSVRSQY